MLRRRYHGYNFIYRKGTSILDDDKDDDASYSLSDHKYNGEYPYLLCDVIIELEIAGLHDNINDYDDDINTDNINDDNTNVHDDSDINISHNYELNTNYADINDNIYTSTPK